MVSKPVRLCDALTQFGSEAGGNKGTRTQPLPPVFPVSARAPAAWKATPVEIP